MSSLETKLRKGSDGLGRCSGCIMNTPDRKPQRRLTGASWHERRMLRIGCDGDDPLWQPLIEVAKINRSL